MIYKNFMLKCVMVILLVAGNSIAYGLIDLEILGGLRSGKMEFANISENTTSEKLIKATEIGIGLRFSFPVIPISFGLLVESDNYNLDSVVDKQFNNAFDRSVAAESASFFDFNSTKASLTSLQYGPEVKVWLPFGKFKPHFRLAYLMGAYTMSQKAGAASKDGVTPITDFKLDGEMSYQATSSKAGLGVTYSIFPLVSLIAEYNIGRSTLKVDKYDVKYSIVQDGQDVYSISNTKADFASQENKFSTTAFRLGVMLSL